MKIRDPLGQDPLWPHPLGLIFIGRVRYTGLGIPSHWRGGEGAGIKDIFLRRNYFNPTMSTGKSWMELGGRRVPKWAKTPDWLPAPLLNPYKTPAGSPTCRPCLHPVLPVSQQLKVIEDISLLQETEHHYNLEPQEQFGSWFQPTEPLSEDKR